MRVPTFERFVAVYGERLENRGVPTLRNGKRRCNRAFLKVRVPTSLGTTKFLPCSILCEFHLFIGKSENQSFEKRGSSHTSEFLLF
ncbi:hypothetical protein A0128_14285 [Leptospira tipperaryensis]|uniref:Uncharacterized protein n=1 Tax=Leptospira tipperaryensis TaxID=2564040 RepID=A0A1D7UZ94_9LEPT|nr:hypothetical protein A0128_14285 [Leptospira tipperaryensis]